MAELAKRELARRHLLDFVTYNFPEYKINWHHRLLAEKLEEVERGTLKKLMVFMPPRHGKSELCSIQFPSWYVGRNKDKNIIQASYSADLAHDFGRQTRNLVASDSFKAVFPDVTLADDSQSKGKWNTNGRGAYNAVGVGGAVIGKGAECIAEGEMVETIDGPKPIEEVKIGAQVLSFNENTRRIEFRRVVAFRCVGNKNVVSLDGKVLCTDDHPVYDGYKYVQAKECRRVYALLPDSLRKLRKRVHKTVYRLEGKTSVEVLLLLLLQRLRIKEVVQALPRLWKKNEAWLSPHVYGLQEDGEDTQKRKTYSHLSVLWPGLQGEVLAKPILLNSLQESRPLGEDEGGGESELQDRERKLPISNGFQGKSPNGKEKGRGYLRRLWKLCKACPPSEPGQNGRQDGESYYSLQPLPFENPQVEDIRPERIVEVGRRKVFDIQVENNQNFFVNGILVHNCLIIDDPVKNRQDANSPIYRETVWDWYRSTARTRLSPDGAIIVVLTRWHEDDLAGRILKNDPDGWEILELPAIAIKDDEYRKVGEPLWPGHYSQAILEGIKKDIGSFEWSSLYQQRPIDEESQEFKKDWFMEADPVQISMQETTRYMTVDTAISERDSSDNTGIVINYVSRENKWHFKAYKLKVNAMELINLLFKFQADERLDKIGIEETVYSQAIRPFLEDEQRRRNVFLPIVPLKHNQIQKEIRIRGLIPRYQSKSIFHLPNQCRDLEDELLHFPKGVHDDVADAAAYQLQIAQPPSPLPPRIAQNRQRDESFR